MDTIDTKSLINTIKEKSPMGVQVGYRMGVLTRTNAIYYHKNKIFRFFMEDDFNFDERFGYTEIEFTEEFKNYKWIIEDIIS